MYKFIAIGALAVLTIVTQGTVTDAAEIKVLASTTMAEVIEELAPRFERDTGNKVKMEFVNSATLTKRIADGEAADVMALRKSIFGL